MVKMLNIISLAGTNLINSYCAIFNKKIIINYSYFKDKMKVNCSMIIETEKVKLKVIWSRLEKRIINWFTLVKSIMFSQRSLFKDRLFLWMFVIGFVIVLSVYRYSYIIKI